MIVPFWVLIIMQPLVCGVSGFVLLGFAEFLQGPKP